MDNSAPQPPPLSQYLPFGENLRVFLEHPTITPSALRSILRNRGVFLADYEKKSSVPHLSLATITPEEFGILLELKRSKEEAPKTVHTILPWQSNQTLEAAVNNLEDLHTLVDASDSFKVVSFTPLEPVDGNADHLKCHIEVERHDLHKSWAENTGAHSGVVEIKKIGKGEEARLSITSTIPETKEVCRDISKKVASHFRSEGHVLPGKEENLEFNTFDNSSRVKFLLSLTGATSTAQLTFKSIKSAEIALDSSKQLPREIQTLLKQVRQMSMKGDDLQEGALLQDAKYHAFILLHEIEVSYEFDYHGAKGTVLVAFRFAKTSKGSPGEFEVIPHSIAPSASKNSSDRKAVTQYVHELVHEFAFARRRVAIATLAHSKAAQAPAVHQAA